MVDTGEATNVIRLARNLHTDLNLLERITESDGAFTIRVPHPLGNSGELSISGADVTALQNRASGYFVDLQNLVSGLSWP